MADEPKDSKEIRKVTGKIVIKDHLGTANYAEILKGNPIEPSKRQRKVAYQTVAHLEEALKPIRRETSGNPAGSQSSNPAPAQSGSETSNNKK